MHTQDTANGAAELFKIPTLSIQFLAHLRNKSQGRVEVEVSRVDITEPNFTSIIKMMKPEW